jgi:hypothetical protein
VEGAEAVRIITFERVYADRRLAPRPSLRGSNRLNMRIPEKLADRRSNLDDMTMTMGRKPLKALVIIASPPVIGACSKLADLGDRVDFT